MAELKKLKIGQKVMVYDALDGKAEGTIVVINDPKESPGKHIGVKFDQHHPSAHECDGACEKGFGWWTLPEQLAVL